MGIYFLGDGRGGRAEIVKHTEEEGAGRRRKEAVASKKTEEGGVGGWRGGKKGVAKG